MPRYKIAPTKANLFKMKHEQDFAEEGHTLLEQKREILISQLTPLIVKAETAQKEFDISLQLAYDALKESIVRIGFVNVENGARAVNFCAEVNVDFHSIVGIEMPSVDVIFKDNPPYYSLFTTDLFLDSAVEKFKDVVRLLGKFAEIKVKILKIAREATKTMRRVNALEKIYLPDYKDTIKYIVDSLEEQEREAFFTLKLVKARLSKKDI